MGDPGFVPGLIGVLLQMTISQIVLHISRFRRWKKLLADLKDTLEKIKPIVDLALNNQDEVLVVDNWFRELYALLKQASEIVEKCTTIRRWDALSRHQTSTKISAVTKDIDKHVAMSGLVHMVQFQVKIQEILDGNKQVIEAVAAHSVSASIFQPDHQPVGRINSKKGDKIVTGTASRPSNVSKVSSFQDEQLGYLLSRDGAPSYESTIMQIYELSENSIAGQCSVSDVEEGDCTENQWFGQVLCDFPARCDDELNLIAGEEVEILEEHGKWLYVSKKWLGRGGKMAGWVPALFVNSSCRKS